MPPTNPPTTDAKTLLALTHLKSLLRKPGNFTLVENTLGTQEEGERLRRRLRDDLKGADKETQAFFDHVLRGWTCTNFHLILVNTRED